MTRKIHDFTPEQLKNLSAIVWLYRGQVDRFVALVAEHVERMVEETEASVVAVQIFAKTFAEVTSKYVNGELKPELNESLESLKSIDAKFDQDTRKFKTKANEISNAWRSLSRDNDALKMFTESAEPVMDVVTDLIRRSDQIYELMSRIADAERDNVRESPLKVLDEARNQLIEQLKSTQYFWRQARWLQERFPNAEFRNVEGLVKLVSYEDLNANDCSLTPGRYVGVAPEEEDEDFDFEQVLREIHGEIEALDEEAKELANTIKKNLKELGICVGLK